MGNKRKHGFQRDYGNVVLRKRWAVNQPLFDVNGGPPAGRQDFLYT